MGAAQMRSFRQTFLGQFLLAAIVVAIIVAFALTGASGSGEISGDDCVVKVGKDCVDPKEYNAALGLVLSVGINERAVKQLDLKRKVARGLAERAVLLREAKRLGISTSEKAVDAELLEGHTRVSLPAVDRERLAMNLALCIDTPEGCVPGTIGLRGLPVLQDGEFDYTRYERMIRRTTGRSPNHFKEMQVREHTAERLRQLIVDPVRVSEEEAYLALERTQSKAIARQLVTQVGWFERYLSYPTEANLVSYAQEHGPELDKATEAEKARLAKGCPIVRELVLTTGGDSTDEAVLARAKKLGAELKILERAETVIRTHSQADSARLGGRIGCLDESYGPGFEELAAATKELVIRPLPTVSEPVRTSRGYTVLLVEAAANEQNAAELARAVARYPLASRALGLEAARNFTAQVLERAQKGLTLEAALEEQLEVALAGSPLTLSPSKTLRSEGAKAALEDERRPKTDISAPFSIEGNPLPSVTGDTSPAALVFAMTEEGQLCSAPIALADGYALLQLKEKDPYTREEFQKDKGRVLHELSSRKAEQILAEYVEGLIEKSGGISYDNRYAPSAGDEAPPSTPEG